MRDMGKEIKKNKSDDNKAKWNLYVLRYNFSGNYYVGITENLEKRMLAHWRRELQKKDCQNGHPKTNQKKALNFTGLILI